LREALERIRPEMAALEPEELVVVDGDPIADVAMVRGALQQVKPFITEIRALPGFRGEDLDQLDLYASALVQAHTSYLGITAPPEHLVALVEEITFLRELLLSDARKLIQLGVFSELSLEKLRGSTGFRNAASDVTLLVTLLKRSWRDVEGKICITKAELERAEVLAEQLAGPLGLHEQAPATVSAVTRERQQVYTLFVRAYDQLRRAIEYLRWDCGDAAILVPPLAASRRPKRTAASPGSAEVVGSVTPSVASPGDSSCSPPGAVPPVSATSVGATSGKPREANARHAEVDPFVL
jgi:hypothetical protein